jgi:hypothetical protein
MNMNLAELIDHKVRVWFIGQGQENLIPDMSFDGELKGIDQGTYIFKTKDKNSGADQYVVMPISSCKLSLVP